MVPEVVDEAELAVLDAELDELELVDVVVGEGFWLVVEGDGGEVLVVCGVVQSGVEGIEAAVLYQRNMTNNGKRNTHNGRRKTKVGGPALRCCCQQEEGLRRHR